MTRRSTVLLLGAMALAGVTTASTAFTTPIQAVPQDVCAGAGEMRLDSPFFHPGSPTPTTPTTVPVSAHSAAFVAHFDTVGACAVSGSPISAAGAVHGWCDLFFGSGTSSLGDTFHLAGIGGVVVVTGGLAGVLATTSNTFASTSCGSGTTRFHLAGAVVRQSCTQVDNTSTSSVSIPTTNTSVAGLAHVRTHGNLHPTVRACV